MIFDFMDPIGAIQTIVSILIIIEVVQALDKDDMGAHIQERVAFYSGIGARAGSVFKMVFSQIFSMIFSRKEEDPPDITRDLKEVYQMEEEDPFEGEGGIEG